MTRRRPSQLSIFLGCVVSGNCLSLTTIHGETAHRQLSVYSFSVIVLDTMRLDTIYIYTYIYTRIHISVSHFEI